MSMKRVIVMICALVLLISLVACVPSEEETAKEMEQLVGEWYTRQIDNPYYIFYSTGMCKIWNGNQTGKWSVSNGYLTITDSLGEEVVYKYSLEGGVLTIDVNGEGLTLEFHKSPW